MRIQIQLRQLDGIKKSICKKYRNENGIANIFSQYIHLPKWRLRHS